MIGQTKGTSTLFRDLIPQPNFLEVKKVVMQIRFITRKREGKVGWILLWVLGVPIPILLILFLVRGCT